MTNSELQTSNDPEISIIVPHYNDLGNLRHCLEALKRQTLAAARFEVIVADNGSADGIAAVTQVAGDFARVVFTLKRGAGLARNAGAEVARGDVLAFTDSDCRPDPEWLENGINALRGFDFVGGRMRVTSEHEDRRTPVEAYEAVFAFNNERYVRTRGFTVTANLLMERKVFDAVGGFRAGVSEDVEWCRRATRAGFRLGYASEAIISHPARRNWIELIKKWRRLTHEMYMLSIDEGRGRIAWFVRSWLVLASPLWNARVVLSSRELHSAAERRGALAVLFALRIWRFVESLRLLAMSERL